MPLLQWFRPCQQKVLVTVLCIAVLTGYTATAFAQSHRSLIDDFVYGVRQGVNNLSRQMLRIAWPTVEYVGVQYLGYDRLSDGYDIGFRLHGRSAWGEGPLWVDIILTLSTDLGLQDLSFGAYSSNALVPPGFTAALVTQGTIELAKAIDEGFRTPAAEPRVARPLSVPQSPERLSEPPVARPPNITPAPVGQEGLPTGALPQYPLLQQLLQQAMVAGGRDNEAAILATTQQVETHKPIQQVAQRARQQAQEANARGLRAVNAGDWTTAVAAFGMAAQLHPTHAEILNNLGYAYLQRGDLQAAEHWFLQALRVAPTRTNAWANLGQTYAQHGFLTAAGACFAHAYRFSSNRSTTRTFLTTLATTDPRPGVRQAAQRTLQLPWLQEGQLESAVR